MMDDKKRFNFWRPNAQARNGTPIGIRNHAIICLAMPTTHAQTIHELDIFDGSGLLEE